MAPLVYLVTGCSSGFGLSFVHQIVARGDLVIATARDTSKLEPIKGGGVSILELDVTWSLELIKKAIEYAISIYGHIDVLINNAGNVVAGPMEELSTQRLQAQFNANFFGPVNITNACLSHFRSRRTGTLIFIGSIAAWGSEAGAGAYCASKAALASVVLAYEEELRPFGIRTFLIEPGYFRTSLLVDRSVSSASHAVEASTIDDYTVLNSAIKVGMEEYNGAQPGDPAKGASRILDLVSGTGLAANKSPIVRICLGADGVKHIRDECKKTLETIDQWTEFSSSTNL